MADPAPTPRQPPAPVSGLTPGASPAQAVSLAYDVHRDTFIVSRADGTIQVRDARLAVGGGGGDDDDDDDDASAVLYSASAFHDRIPVGVAHLGRTDRLVVWSDDTISLRTAPGFLFYFDC